MVRARQPIDTRAHKARALEVLKQFRLVYGSVRQHFRDIEAHCGVSGSQLWLLHEVSQAPGIGVSELARRLAIHQTTCSQLVEKLVTHGYLVKRRSREDQRRVGLTLRPAAAAVLKDAPGPAEGVLPEALVGLSGATLQALARDLAAVIAGLRRLDAAAAGRLLADL